MLARLKEVAGVGTKKDVPQVAVQDYARDVWKNGKSGNGIQVIVAEGEIVDGESGGRGIGGGTICRAELRAAREDDKVVKAVRDARRFARRQRNRVRRDPFGNPGPEGGRGQTGRGLDGASWPHRVATGSPPTPDAIVAQPETLTGSIGVFGMLPNIEKFAEEHGLRAEVVRTSPLAGFQSIWHHKDEAQVARIQTLVDRIYDRFLDLVSEGRSLPRERVHEIAQGRVWSGRRGVELGLVDEIGGLDRAIAIAREKAKLDSDAPVRYERREKKFIDELLEEVLAGEREPLTHALAGQFDALHEALEVFEHARKLAGASGVVARLPFDFVVR